MNKIFISSLILAISAYSNVALSAPLIQPTTKPVTVPAVTPTPTTTPGTTSGALSAVNDFVYVVPVLITSVTGNVTTNDKGFTTAYLQSSPIGSYGILAFDDLTGVFTYTLNDDANLNRKDKVTDQFVYILQAGGKTVQATLTVTIFAKEPNINEEVESNNTSVDATPLNSGQMIKGNLSVPTDRDWYAIGSSTGDEIIHIEVCAKGSVCFGKKSWVMYVFDSDKLTDPMENASVNLRTFRNDTGATIQDYPLKDMYLAYNYGKYDDALIGVVDPCFDTTNSVDIGVPKLVGGVPKKYYIAISVPLKRDGTGCSDGNVVLKKPGFSFAEGSNTIQTTEEYISYYPNSDDEYALKVSHTGNAPGGGLAPTPTPLPNASTYVSGQAAIPSFNEKLHQLTIPKLRIFNDLYSATLNYKGSFVKKSNDPSQVITMTLKKITGLLEPLSGDPYQGTFNPDSDQVALSTLRDSKTGITYSAVFQYHQPLGNKALWLETISVSPTQ